MYNYSPVNSVYQENAEMRERIRELEEVAASAELALDVAYDEIEEGLRREQRLLWTALALGTLAAAAIMQMSWMMVGR